MLSFINYYYKTIINEGDEGGTVAPPKPPPPGTTSPPGLSYPAPGSERSVRDLFRKIDDGSAIADPEVTHPPRYKYRTGTGTWFYQRQNGKFQVGGKWPPLPNDPIILPPHIFNNPPITITLPNGEEIQVDPSQYPQWFREEGAPTEQGDWTENPWHPLGWGERGIIRGGWRRFFGNKPGSAL